MATPNGRASSGQSIARAPTTGGDTITGGLRHAVRCTARSGQASPARGTPGRAWRKSGAARASGRAQACPARAVRAELLASAPDLAADRAGWLGRLHGGERRPGQPSGAGVAAAFLA